MNKTQYDFKQFEEKTEPYKKKIEVNKIFNGISIHGFRIKNFRKILFPFDSYLNEPLLHTSLADTQTIEGYIKPVEKLKPMQLRKYIVNNFIEFQNAEKSKRNLGRLIQAIMLLLALFGFVELLIWLF